MSTPETGPGTWHVPDRELVHLVSGDGSTSGAWSVEQHLLACAPCRDRLAAVGAQEPRMVRSLGVVRDRLLGDLPPQLPVVPTGPRRRLTVLALGGPAARVPFLLAVVGVLAAAVLLDARGTSPLGGALTGDAGGTAWLRLLAPLLPMVGVGVAYGPGTDAAHEVLAATPAGGLRLLLQRTASVLAVTVPVAAVVGAVTGGWAGLAWLLPALAFTAATLATGTLTRLDRSAAGWALVWVVVAGAPLLRPRLDAVVDPAASTGWACVLLVVACVVIAVRRDRVRMPSAVEQG